MNEEELEEIEAVKSSIYLEEREEAEEAWEREHYHSSVSMESLGLTWRDFL